MAVTLPVLGLSSAVTPLRSYPRHAHLSNSSALPLVCRVSGCRALRRDPIVSNSCEGDFASRKSVEHCSGSGRSTEELFGRASALAVAGSLLSAGASLADEEGVFAAIDGSDAGISTTVSVLFVAATVGLVVLTGGVIYLGLSEFLEKRALQEEQKKVEEAKPKKPSKQAVKAAARAGGPKGFGSSKRTKDDAEDLSGSD